jgi:hypothetical protein
MTNTCYNYAELKVGSFNWEQLNSNGLSPTASPQLTKGNTSSAAATLTLGNEYKLFIKSIRNLIHNSMIDKGALSLGEFFLYPNNDKNEGDIISIVEEEKDQIKNNTMLASMYNIYLTSSHLVFQPNTRRMRIRPLEHSDMYIKNKKG